MTNEQKFFGELTEYGRKCITTLHGVDVFTGEPQKCRDMNCGNCLLQGQGDCNKSFRQWLKQEYKEPVKLTEFERELLKKFLSKEYKYMVKNRCGEIIICRFSPKRQGGMWLFGSADIDTVFFRHVFDNTFNFVKNEKVYSIEDLLKEE